jgi:hypothetical protein
LLDQPDVVTTTLLSEHARYLRAFVRAPANGQMNCPSRTTTAITDNDGYYISPLQIGGFCAKRSGDIRGQ